MNRFGTILEQNNLKVPHAYCTADHLLHHLVTCKKCYCMMGTILFFMMILLKLARKSVRYFKKSMQAMETLKERQAGSHHNKGGICHQPFQDVEMRW